MPSFRSENLKGAFNNRHYFGHIYSGPCDYLHAPAEPFVRRGEGFRCFMKARKMSHNAAHLSFLLFPGRQHITHQFLQSHSPKQKICSVIKLHCNFIETLPQPNMFCKWRPLWESGTCKQVVQLCTTHGHYHWQSGRLNLNLNLSLPEEERKHCRSKPRNSGPWHPMLHCCIRLLACEFALVDECQGLCEKKKKGCTPYHLNQARTPCLRLHAGGAVAESTSERTRLMLVPLQKKIILFTARLPEFQQSSRSLSYSTRPHEELRRALPDLSSRPRKKSVSTTTPSGLQNSQSLGCRGDCTVLNRAKQ